MAYGAGRRRCAAAGPRCRGGSRARPAPARPPTRPPGRAPRRWRCRRRAARAPPRGRCRARPRRSMPTTNSASMPELRGDPGVVLARLLLHVHAGQLDGQPADAGEVPLGGEGQVGVAAAEVDDPQRLLGGRSAHVAPVDRVGERRVEQPEELLDLAVLRLPARLDPTLRRRCPSATSTGSSSGSIRSLSRSWPRSSSTASARSEVCTTASSRLVTRTWWVWVAVSTCQLANGSSSRSSTASRASSPAGGWRCAPGWRRTP